MAEGATGKAEGAAAKKGKGKKLLLVAAAGLLVLAGGGGAAAYFLGLFPGGGGPSAAEAADGHGAAADEAHGDHADASGHGAEAGSGQGGKAGGPPGGVLFVDVPDLLVNLQPDGKRMRFLRLRLALEAESAKGAENVTALMPRVLDSFQMYLRALTVDEVQGSAGMQRLKEEMVARVNLAIEPERVRDILVKEMLVQ